MRTRLRAIVPWLAVLFVRAEPPSTFAKAPKLLSQTGLYSAGATVDPANLAYAPQYPLWSDGAAKSRWCFLPPGTTIDVRDPDHGEFPVGTKFWKEFSFGGRRVETRLIWKKDARSWGYATYDWKADGADAALAPESGVVDRVDLGGGKRHSLTSVDQCKRCHENGRGEILGCTALQLSIALVEAWIAGDLKSK